MGNKKQKEEGLERVKKQTEERLSKILDTIIKKEASLSVDREKLIEAAAEYSKYNGEYPSGYIDETGKQGKKLETTRKYNEAKGKVEGLKEELTDLEDKFTKVKNEYYDY